MATLEEFSSRISEPVETVRRWRELGLVAAGPEEPFGHVDIERARLVRRFLRHDVAVEDIARSVRGGWLSRLLDRYLDAVFPGQGRPGFGLDEAARRTGLDLAVARRLWTAAVVERREEFLSTDDLLMLESCRTVLESGFPEEALLQLLRTWADTLGRAAEVTARLFHFYVHEQAERQGRDGEAGVENMAVDLEPLVEPAILYHLRKGLIAAQPEDMVMHLVEETGERVVRELPGQVLAAVLFVDLSGFTALTDAMGDARAVEVLERFSSVVRDSVGRFAGRVVKQIGDGFLVVFGEPRSAVECALEIEERTGSEPQFPAVRSGIHWGSALYRDGDYLGSSVNTASRVVSAAERHQVLVTAAVRREAEDLPGVSFRPCGARRVKGLSEELELFEAQRVVDGTRPKVVDPVCHMELVPGEAAADLSLDGRRVEFCSAECLRRFVANPDRYPVP